MENLNSFKGVIAIDTSTKSGEVAVWRQGKVIYTKSFESERSHNAQMFEPLAEALEAVGPELQLILVGTGPGSYTGVRIGIAAAQGLAWSRNVPVIGLSSLLAPASQGDEETEWVMCGDARRGQYYVVRVKHGRLNGEIETLSLDEWRTRKESWRHLKWRSYDVKPPAGMVDIELTQPSAEKLIHCVLTMSEEEFSCAQQRSLEPVYLSAPFVTMASRGAV